MMNKLKPILIQTLKWGALGVYSFFAYHLLLVPFVLEFSIIGLVIGWGGLLALFFIIPSKNRKQVAIYLFLLVFTVKALENIGFLINFTRISYFIIVLLAIYIIGRFYGKLSNTIVMTLIATVIIINFTVDRGELRMANHFTKLWESPVLYTGNTVDYFPLTVRDIDNDGQYEIITFGHSHELVELYEERVRKGLDPDRMPYDLEEEKLFIYIYKWDGKEFTRVDNETVDLDELRPYLPKDYIGFPYFVWDEDFTLVPQTQLQDLAEKTGQFGASPFHIFNQDIHAINQYLTIYDGIYDKKDEFNLNTNIEQIKIEDGELNIVREGNDIISMSTRATKIIDLIQTDDGLGLLLLSDQLELWNITDGNELELTHVLTENEISDVMNSEYIVADLQHDGNGEILISSATSRIIKPLPNGEWDILFTSRDTSLRFEDFGTIGSQNDPGIVALSKSLVRNNPLRFLTGFSYTDEGLQQDWKSFLSLINVSSVDITGDGQNELVATIWRSHRIYVFSKHGLPVTTFLLSILALFVLYTAYWRRKTHA
ncbi:hypothetical protein ACERII_18665 [Evansella sp. AB-rgal1]|uniref:hypothetical protein n=1 Tax=Evansella sp. AB-rgal1 TaxID=3242696 RepID=UPI00359E38C5